MTIDDDNDDGAAKGKRNWMLFLFPFAVMYVDGTYSSLLPDWADMRRLSLHAL